MVDVLQILLISVGSSLATFGMFLLYFKRTLPVILNNIGEDVAEAFGGVFKEFVENPTVKRAYSILGNESGKVRHDMAKTREFEEAEKVMANKLLDNVAPEIKMIIDQFAPDFIEEYGPDVVLALAQKYGPLLQQFLPQILENFGKSGGSSHNAGYKGKF